ncbi:MAG: hypothetical protein HYZ69_03410, partial [Candidatus Colwellbacteria bacterium]|nr:hypothetical protein [Candidatus Colwellbacteria bacterium]
KNVLYTTSERFISEFISLIRERQPLVSFKEKYRGVDVLLIDDIQFIAGKTKCQEELFHTFNTLHERNKQIVFTSDQPPHTIPDLEDRLRSRFAAGLIADISDPEPEARLAIIAQKAKEKNILISQPILEYISSTFQRNIRELEGVVTAVIAHSRMRQTQLSFEEAKHIIDQCKAQTKKSTTAAEILETVARIYEINEQELSAQTRKKEIVIKRILSTYYHHSQLQQIIYININSMKCIIKGEQLKRIISKGGKVAERKAQNPLWESVLLCANKEQRSLKAETTNLELWTECNAPATVEREGSIAIPARPLAALAPYIHNDDEIILEQEGQILKIITKTGKTALHGYNARDFPLFSSSKKESIFHIKSSIFLPLLKRALVSAAR